MIAISVCIGLGAVVLASRWISQQAATVASNKVVVAALDIDLGTPLTPQMLKLADWPVGSVPAGAATDINTVGSRVVKTSLLRGEPILESKLAPIGATGGLSAVIAEGNRAMTVRVNDVVGVAGFALPGNYVDIVVNTEDESVRAENVNKSISKIVLEHIMVLAVAQEQNRDETKPKVVNAVTLEVTPDQAEKLDLARSVGTLSLVLRNQIDKSLVTTEGSTKKALLNRLEPPVVETIPATQGKPVIRAVARKPVAQRNGVRKANYQQVEVVRGTTKSIEEFRSTAP